MYLLAFLTRRTTQGYYDLSVELVLTSSASLFQLYFFDRKQFSLLRKVVKIRVLLSKKFSYFMFQFVRRGKPASSLGENEYVSSKSGRVFRDNLWFCFVHLL